MIFLLGAVLSGGSLFVEGGRGMEVEKGSRNAFWLGWWLKVDWIREEGGVAAMGGRMQVRQKL